MKKALLLGLIAFVSLAGCSSFLDEVGFVASEDDYTVTHAMGEVVYEVTVTKPTPCHEVSHTSSIQNSTLKIDYDAVSDAEQCVQKVEDVTLTGRIPHDGSRPEYLDVSGQDRRSLEWSEG